MTLLLHVIRSTIDATLILHPNSLRLQLLPNPLHRKVLEWFFCLCALLYGAHTWEGLLLGTILWYVKIYTSWLGIILNIMVAK